MGNRQRKRFRTYWLLMNFILLVLASLLSANLSGFWANLAGLSFGALIIQSYPLSLLPMFLLFRSGILDDPFWMMILMNFFVAPICFATGYIQWFILFPRLVKFIRQTFFRRDIQIHLTTTVASVKPLLTERPDFPTQDWQKSWYDKEKRTPVERVFEKDES